MTQIPEARSIVLQPDGGLAARWSAQLDVLQGQGRYRTLSLPRGADFQSNDYLGYGRGRLLGLAPENADALPRSGLASRLLGGHHLIWEEVETKLARWHGAEAALFFTSGYAANEGLLSTLIEPGDWVASDTFNHASLIDGLRLSRAERFVYRHLDLDHLETGLRSTDAASPGRQRFIVTESLFSMDGDLAPLTALAELSERYCAHLIVDEAHTTGCFGPTGSGCVDAAGLRSRVLATVHTGGKALGVFGAYICGSALLKELLINRSRHFIFTTALPPAVGAWWLDMLTTVPTDHAGRAALRSVTATFRTELSRLGVGTGGSHYIVPVVLGHDDRATALACRLQEKGWDMRAIRPPSVPPGTARLRISLHADHTTETLLAAAHALAEELAR
jgi:8-amino-7-oxononanoate synthase